MIARLEPRDTIIAKSGFTPLDVSRKYCKGTMRKPPPTPRSPDAKPANIPIRASPMIKLIERIKMKAFNLKN